MTAAEKVDHCIDWRRQRPVLETLRRGEPAGWRPYDWDADDGRLRRQPATCQAKPIVILEGVYSARPELADLFDLRVLLAAPDEVRRDRLTGAGRRGVPRRMDRALGRGRALLLRGGNAQ